MWSTLFSTPNSAIIIAFVVDSTAGLSGNTKNSFLLQNRFDTSAEFIFNYMSTTFSSLHFVKSFLFKPTTSRFYDPAFFVVSVDHRESRKQYLRAFIKESCVALLHILHVSDKNFLCFCLNSAHLETASTDLCRLSLLGHVVNKGSALG